MNAGIAASYQQRADQFEQLNKELAKKDKYLSIGRTLLFIIAMVGFVYFANAREGLYVFMILLLLVIFFPLLIKYHNKIKVKRNHLWNLRQINLDEIKRLQNQLKEFDNGSKYQDGEHPYTGDLDIFGKHSLFQLINRSNTSRGRDKVAQWMKTPAHREEVMQRQEAVKELVNDLDWNQHFQAHGMESKAKEEDTDTLLKWIKEPTVILQKNTYQAASRIMPMITIAAIIAYYMLDSSGFIPVAAIFVNGFILWSTADLAGTTHQKTSKGVGVLKAYLGMIRMIEKRNFNAPLNHKLKQSLQAELTEASKEIKKLEYILDNFDARGNLFYHIFNIIFLLDVYWLLKAERWKKHVNADIELWFEAVNNFEALISIAGFTHANPGYTFPEISERPYIFKAQQLAHCLIDKQQRVANDFSMEGRGTINIITGSNMSGKSTFLRTVGINTVLALTGAPVCAKQLTVSEMQVFTSMRTQDSLEESVSSFYAELKRLRQLLESLKMPEKPIMFMLDEILKGTNSQDRHHGAASLIKQLSKLEATGFVSTHDLELGRLEETLPNVKNYSFSSTIEHDEIYFDYKIHQGICKSFNASKLMAKMGIAIEE